MKILASILCAAWLAGCSTVPPLDKSIAIGRPSKFNADPDRYDHKIVYIRAYMATSPHWWQFFFYGRKYKDDDQECLSFDENDWIMSNRYEINKQFLVVKGTFIKGYTQKSVYGNCANGNGFVVDEDFMKKRYGLHYGP